MDKYDIIFDLVEHPDRYNEEQMTKILSDPEVREIYNLLCKSASAVKASAVDDNDVDAEWRDFVADNIDRRPKKTLYGSRAASVIGFTLLSLVAVAVGLAVTLTVIDRKSDTVAEAATADGVSETYMPVSQPEIIGDSIVVLTTPIVFEDETLENILALVASHYGLDVRFGDSEAATLHLYFNFDPSQKVDQVISRLNTFEQINIRIVGKSITVD